MSYHDNAVFAIHYTLKLFNRLYFTNKIERFSFKSGSAMVALAYSVAIRILA